MIERYTRKQMGEIWTDSSKYSCWLKVELAVCQAWAKRGVIDQKTYDEIIGRAGFSTSRIEELEEELHHDVIAFLTSVSEKVGLASRYIHLGMTSSDILDTGLALQIKLAGHQILHDFQELQEALVEKAVKWKSIPSVGRTHGIHAEPVSFGLRFARFFDQLKRTRGRFEDAWRNSCVGKLSGAVGAYVHLDPEMEVEVMDSLDLGVAPISSQVVSRDRIADLLSSIALVGTVLESIGLEIRHLQRTEVGEAREGFAKGQKGSSAMPHKRNPINAEKICGLARLLRANMQAAYENVALWHERDISHSSVERVILPDSFIVLDYLLVLTTRLVKNLVIDRKRIEENLNMTGGAIFSEGLLLALVFAGQPREDAYRVVQQLAHKALDSGESFRNTVLSDPSLKKRLGDKKLAQIFNIDNAMRHVNKIYERLGLPTTNGDVP